MERPDSQRVLKSLKDFQLQTVEHVFARMYTDPNPTRRFLIADEVGLGKTLVARGLTAKVVDHLWEEKGRRIDIVYVCSNQDIARQNIARLNITGSADFALASRITLMPVQVRDLKARRLNFVSLTPSTSLELMEGTGMAKERALLYWLLAEEWNIEGKPAMNVLADAVRPDRFRARIHDFDTTRIDEDLAKAFHERLRRDHDGLRRRFLALCDVFKRADARTTDEERRERRHLIGELRAALAASCLEALEPDLIILDEFQRFKHLLHEGDEAGRLARELFEYGAAGAEVRVLLLSATPYKMYTLNAEPQDGDDHYADFLKTTEFLLGSKSEGAECADLVQRYRRALLGLADGDLTAIDAARRDLEAVLRSVMVRTERLAVREDRDGMLTTLPASTPMDPRELLSFVTYQRVADKLDAQDTLEYWKSAPYLLNFMEGYELKNHLDEGLEDPGTRSALARTLGRGHGILLPWERVEKYEAVALPNGRMRWLHQRTVEAGLWRMLWVPPSLPYYAPSGPWAGAGSVTKQLVFSSWHVVPKSAAALLSYDAERRMMRERETAPSNTPEAREKVRGLLQFALRDGVPDAMTLFALFFPSARLAELGDVAAMRGQGRSYQDGLAAVRERVELELAPLLAKTKSGGRPDDAWYWAAMVLLDRAVGSAVDEWLAEEELPWAWTNLNDAEAEAGDAESGGEAFEAHAWLLAQAKLGKLGTPPADLADVLARVAIAGPAVCAYRALRRASGAPADAPWLRDAAARVSWGFRTLFNQPAVMMMVRGLSETRYWELVLDYCGAGCLQAVLDEYAHVLVESLGLVDKPPDAVAQAVADRIRQSMSLRISTIGVDHIESDGSEIRKHAGAKMRQQFAMRFSADRETGDDKASRPDQVRTAFNSPFWPFVLVSTSVGQEGLDFHQFCHAVVHWNLPANPVDMEQREGRVHRYKGHAVRKNVAQAHGSAEPNEPPFVDVWRLAFERAAAARPVEYNELYPYWVYPLAGGATIERHVPHVPLSRDARQLDALRRSLAVYRMAFGQPRQEDLVAHLLSRMSAEEIAKRLDTVAVRLGPGAPA